MAKTVFKKKINCILDQLLVCNFEQSNESVSKLFSKVCHIMFGIVSFLAKKCSKKDLFSS